MVEDRDRKRTPILHRPDAVEGEPAPPVNEGMNDFPLTNDEAPALPAGSPKPISIQDMAEFLRCLTTDQRDGNAFPTEAGFGTTSIREEDGSPVEFHSPTGDVFAPDAFLESWGIDSETFTPDQIELLRDPNVGFHDVLRAIVGERQSEQTKIGGVIAGASAGKASVPNPDGASPLQILTSKVLTRNRWNPSPGDSPYLSGQALSTIDSNPIGRSQTKLGAYDPTAVDEVTGITYEKMKKMGAALQVRSTGEFIGRDGDPADFGVGLAAILLPGEAQLAATRLDRKSLWAADLSDVQGVPPGLGKGSDGAPRLRGRLESDLVFDEADPALEGSFGALNSCVEPFGGIFPGGMVALGLALVLAVKILVEAIIAFVGLFKDPTGGGDSAGAAKRTTGPHTLGRSSDEAVESFLGITMQDLGVVSIGHDFHSAVDRGIDIFFQFDGDSFLRVIQSPGYYVVLVRAIIRSGNQIVGGVVNAFDNNPNPLGAAQALIGTIDLIRSSKIFSFINMIAILGDITLGLEDKGILPPDGDAEGKGAGALPDSGKISFQDKLVDNVATHVMKGREKDTLRLAWRNTSTRSMFMLPSSIRVASLFSEGGQSIDELEAGLSDANRVISDPAAILGRRIDPDVVASHEDELDAEYVPFYFHDLRTNEIVSFHAFLASCTDSFSANYDKVNYYGRIDPVMVYSHTERTINISFHVVSTREDDFDIMWWKINKLITMLYPQWSQGRKLKSGEDEFIQPFSQIPSSSPLIRLRLGDVFTTNYSKFALARLFGLGQPGFKLKDAGTTIGDAKKKLEQTLEKNTENFARDLRRMTTPPTMVMGMVGGTFHDGFHEGDRAILRPHPKAPTDGYKFGGQALPSPGPRKPITSMYRTYPVEVELVSNPKPQAGDKSVPFYLVKPIDTNDGVGPYIVMYEDLRPDVKFLRQKQLDDDAAAVAAEAEGRTDEQQIVDEFLREDQNAIVKSFESVAGRGLAGFITSMNFDWKTPTWETTAHGSRAPQWCLVTLTFQPIHDIAPGLDVDGVNRAPVYNVGKLSRQVGRDPYNDGGSESNFKAEHRAVTKLFRNDSGNEE